MEALRMIAILLLLSGASFAAEIAVLRNGFTVLHQTREAREGIVRLYLDGDRNSFVDVPAEEITGYACEPTPARLDPASVDSEPPKPVKRTNQIVAEASATHGVDDDFIRSVIRHESDGNANAVSRTGARGLMQLMPATALQLGVTDSFNPEQNVHGGTRYLRELLERYHGDAVKALAAYNAGPAAVDRYNGVPPYRETRLYVQRVVRDYNKSKDSAKDAPKSAPSVKPAAGSTAVTAR
jgi:hypothetical protein